MDLGFIGQLNTGQKGCEMGERTSYRNRQIKKTKRRKAKRLKFKGKLTPTSICKPVGAGVHLGPDNSYYLSNKALNHILKGEFSERPAAGASEAILTGGLHTYDGWIEFMAKRPEMTHLRFFNSQRDSLWYFSRELSNGVITLKIPKECFQSRAAKNTLKTESYYRSGYLWKTLFPKDTSRQQIVDIIDEALKNYHKEDSSDKIIYGYALRSHPSTAMRVRIQLHGKNIASAFPSWGQPIIGNVGKAYSQIDAIGFEMAGSTEFFNQKDRIYTAPESNVYNHAVGLASMQDNTPQFILERERGNDDADKWWKERLSDLENIAENLNGNDIDSIKAYIKDDIIIKEGFHLQLDVYKRNHGGIIENSFVNAVMYAQNIIETLHLLSSWDRNHQSLHTIDVVELLLRNMIRFNDVMARWNNKRILTSMFKIVNSYYDDSIIPIFINELSVAPSRLDLYIDFDINCYWKKEVDFSNSEDNALFNVIDLPSKTIQMSVKHLADYQLRNMSENYLFHFSIDERRRFVERIYREKGQGYLLLQRLCLQYSLSGEFTRISHLYSKLSERVSSNSISGVDIGSIVRFSRDVLWVQLESRGKLFIENPQYHHAEIYHYELYSEEFRDFIIFKHAKMNITIFLSNLLEKSIELANHLGREKEKIKLQAMLNRSAGEVPAPELHVIPEYIEHFENQEDQSWREEFYKSLDDISVN